MLCSDSHIGNAHDGVRSGGIDLQTLLRSFALKTKLNPLASTNPVLLHRFDLLRPVNSVQIIQQLVRIIGDANKPLIDFTLFDKCPRAPAATIDDLLVGKDGLIDRVPVDSSFFSIGQSFVDHSCKQPLLPAIIIRCAGCQFAIPVVTKAQALQLAAHVINIVVGPGGRWSLVFNGCVFGRHPKGIPTHGL